MIPDSQYTYYLHIAFRTGYSMIAKAEGLPEVGEDFGSYLERQIEVARASHDLDDGLLFFSGDDSDIVAASFHREKTQEFAEQIEELEDQERASDDLIGDAIAETLGVPREAVSKMPTVPIQFFSPNAGEEQDSQIISEQLRTLMQTLQSLERIINRWSEVAGVTSDLEGEG